eukprot:1194778-Prorocentrum_minimum.AAC.5
MPRSVRPCEKGSEELVDAKAAVSPRFRSSTPSGRRPSQTASGMCGGSSWQQENEVRTRPTRSVDLYLSVSEVTGTGGERRQRITPLFHSSGAVRIQKAWVRSRTRRLSCFAMSQAVVRYTDGQLLGIANSVIPKHFQGAVEPIWVAAISKVESEGDPYAYRYEAHIDDASTGLCQLLLGTAKWLARDFPKYRKMGVPETVSSPAKDTTQQHYQNHLLDSQVLATMIFIDNFLGVFKVSRLSLYGR